MQLISRNGIPHWMDESGVVLPVMAGGQTLDRILELRRSGQPDTLPPPSGYFDPRTGNPIPTAQIGNYSFVKDAQGVFRSVTIVTDQLGEQFYEFNVADPSLLRELGFLEPTGGTGRAPPAFSSTQAAQAQAEQFEQAQAQRDAQIAAQAATLLSQRGAEQDRLDREFREEQNRLAEEANLKRQRLATLTDLIQSFMASQSQARETLANLQPDAFRFAAVAGGIAPFGVTPQQGFQTQLQQFAGAAVPQFDASGSAASLEPVIAQLTGAQAPTAPQMFGLAQGGVIEMSKGSDGSYSAVPLPFDVQARLVGENPDGTVNKTTEVMITSSQGVAIIPLGKGAQEGGFFPFSPIKFDASTLLPALGTSGIFGSLGFSEIPSIGQSPGQPSRAGSFPTFGGGMRGPLGTLGALGIQPSFLSPVGSRAVYFRGADGLQLISGEQFQSAGINPEDVVKVGRSSLEGFERGAAFTGPPPVPTEGVSAFTKFSQPIVEPTTGTLLPAPFMVAEQMNKLRLTNPTAFNLLLSAYTSAGVPATAVLGSIQSSLSFGQARGNVGLR